MSFKLSKSQKDVLNGLLDIYENSATYKGTNSKNQSFSLNPEKVFSDYNSDFVDQELVNQFNADMKKLEDSNMVSLVFERRIPVISKIELELSGLNLIYQLLNREDISKKRNKEIEVYSTYLGVHSIIDSFCNEQIERLNNYKDAEIQMDKAINVLKLLVAILENDDEMLERELSISVLGDTKEFENTYRTRVCTIIEKYGELDLGEIDKKEKQKVILEECHIFSNPSYIFLKGNMKIKYIDGTTMQITSKNPVAIFSKNINNIETIVVSTSKIITVENLASYNRVNDLETTFLFLSGYHNTAKQRFLTKIAADNPHLTWFHFGDIDPDGYYILKNLIEKTGIKFEPLYMGIDEIKKYLSYTKKLETNDRVKALSLSDAYFYGEVMQFMLENDCKLEQEIISWERYRKKK